MHQGEEIAPDEQIARAYAAKVVHGVVEFVERNRSDIQFSSL
jgi:hypothetical protein